MGFAYLLLLIAVAVLGTASAAAVGLGSRVARRDAELQLLVIGGDFERALHSYRSAPGAGVAGGPKTLEDLLSDPRSAKTLRHLRQIPADPLTGLPNWALLRSPDGSIVGIHSLAPGQPIKQAGFDDAHAGFMGAQRYAAWVFAAPLPPKMLPPALAGSQPR